MIAFHCARSIPYPVGMNSIDFFMVSSTRMSSSLSMMILDILIPKEFHKSSTDKIAAQDTGHGEDQSDL